MTTSTAKLERLISADDACSRLGLTNTELFWLVSVRGLPGWLVGGSWRFDAESVDAWAAANGGPAELKRWLEAAAVSHREGAAMPSGERGSGGG